MFSSFYHILMNKDVYNGRHKSPPLVNSVLLSNSHVVITCPAVIFCLKLVVAMAIPMVTVTVTIGIDTIDHA